MKPKALVAWSSGKDSAFALYECLKKKELEIVGLFITLRSDSKTVNIHEVHESLVEKQAENLGLPLTKIYLPHPCPNSIYEKSLAKGLESFKKIGGTHIVFGDLFLTDIKKYREDWLSKEGYTGVFPLWGKNTKQLALDFLALGFKARIVAVDPKVLPQFYVGREFDEEFILQLPQGVDPCGENGEFHTFVYDGPVFCR